MKMTEAAYRKLGKILLAQTGQDIGFYRGDRVEASLLPIVQETGFSGFDQFARALTDSGDEALIQRVIEALLNNETYFFRDGMTQRGHVATVLEDIARRRVQTKTIRIWSAGCSTGQEVYSLALAMGDAKVFWDGWKIDLLGTDISHAAINRARKACYSPFEIQRGLSAKKMVLWFNQDGKHWRAKPALRHRVRFKTHDIRQGSPDGLFDVVLCRNVLIYFPAESRAKALASMARALREDGALMVGAGETIGDKDTAFEMIPGLGSFYHLKSGAIRRKAYAA